MLRPIIAMSAALLVVSSAALAGGGHRPHRNRPALARQVDTPFATGPGVGNIECPADVNQDTKVDVDDLIMVILSYGSSATLPADINNDGLIDLLDLLEVIAAWGPCPN